MLIFPLIGACLALPRFLEGVGLLALYRTGEVTHGRLLDRWATGTVVNGRSEMAYSFEYAVPTPGPAAGSSFGGGGGELPYSQISHRVTHKGLDNHAVLNEAWEPIVYDPAKPHVAALMDGLPGGTYVNGEGDFEAPASAWLHALPPLAVVLVNWACAAVASAL